MQTISCPLDSSCKERFLRRRYYGKGVIGAVFTYIHLILMILTLGRHVYMGTLFVPETWYTVTPVVPSVDLNTVCRGWQPPLDALRMSNVSFFAALLAAPAQKSLKTDLIILCVAEGLQKICRALRRKACVP